MDVRLARAENAITQVDGKAGPANSVVQQLFNLRAEVRRRLNKVDALRAADIASLEHHIDRLREVAGDRLHAFGHSAPISEPLRSIFHDSIQSAS
ncbi:hypothetical protein [Rhizobium mongolense]|uniref:hypothetical protein n=1 Tax=Rhizobium mongolense TaxID=57676 RepID=UPI000B8880F9|nr:hypothetical protein [Rhizobium mongolense]